MLFFNQTEVEGESLLSVRVEEPLETAILQSLKINKAHVAVREAVEKARSEAMNPEKEPKEKWKPEQQAEATEIEADIETPSQAPGGNGRESDRKADVFVELGFFLKHFVLQLCPPPPYWQALQDRTVGLTELILSSAWRDTRDVMKRSWNPSLPLRPVIVQALDYYMEDRSISRNQADAILAVFDVLPLDQKRTQPPLWGTLDLNNELEQWKLETE
ncbi:hypothetical protein BGX26_006743 [Mortierella sp. AD094]|nr:hypothetical protein BGX26_006743 [Mortierella sp. AD094]